MNTRIAYEEDIFPLSVHTCRLFSSPSKFDHMTQIYIMFSSLDRKLFELSHPEEVSVDVRKCICKNV